MLKTKVCPSCQFENPDNALICIKCGSLFTTIMNENDPGTITLRSQLDEPAQAVEQEILLFVMNDSQPISLKNQQEIILGRRGAGSEPPTIDLAPYGENQMGVSRRHASIEYKDNGYLIRDLESSNGTFLNETRLIPHRHYHLHSGDRLVLGQLPITVYFKENHQVSDTTFFIRHPEPKLTLNELATTLAPVLQAIAAVQNLADEIAGREAESVGVESIRMDTLTGNIRVHADRPVGVVQIIQEVIIPWKQAHKETLQDDASALKFESVVLAFLSKIKVDIPPEERKIQEAKLFPLIKPILLSALEVSTSRTQES